MSLEKELLPIGSVVQLKDSTVLVMITGFLPISPAAEGESDRVWNYSGFKYPIGYTNGEDIYCFDHEQIQIVYAYGYRDIEHDIFVSQLIDSLNQYTEEETRLAKSQDEESDGRSTEE